MYDMLLLSRNCIVTCPTPAPVWVRLGTRPAAPLPGRRPRSGSASQQRPQPTRQRPAPSGRLLLLIFAVVLSAAPQLLLLPVCALLLLLHIVRYRNSSGTLQSAMASDSERSRP